MKHLALKASECLSSYTLGMRIYDEAMEEFKRTIHAMTLSEVEEAVMILYDLVIKKVETEDHYRHCFQFSDIVAEYGRKFKGEPARGKNIGFVLQNGSKLGHTEALLELIKHLPFKPIIYLLSGKPKFKADHIVCIQEATLLERMETLRKHMTAHEVGTMVWVSAPPLVPLCMPMRLAEKQVFWTLKFHPFHIPEIDIHLTYKRDVEGWSYLPFLMQRPPKSPHSLRSLYPYKTLLGTLARTEKFSDDFIRTVCEILKQNPDCGYLWTGRSHDQRVQDGLSEVKDRCHFVGWVDISLYANSLDVFLETFPFGCGITGMEAVSSGVPVVSMKTDYTLFGMYEAFEPVDYVSEANRMIRDKEYRESCAKMQYDFYMNKIARPEKMAQMFMEIVC